MLSGDELGLGREQRLVLDQDVEHRASANQCLLLRSFERDLRPRTAEAKDEMLARAACKVDQLWVASWTAARRWSSTWLRRCPTVCWACRVCE